MLKKITASIVALILVCNFLCLTSYAQTNDDITLSEFAQNLSSMIQEYSYGLDSGNSLVNNDSETNRLIIKTKDNNYLSNDCGAISKIEGYDCLHIMQYSNEQLASSAYEYYSTLSTVEYVEYDFCFRLVEPKLEYFDYETDPLHLSWGSTTVNANEAISTVNSLGDQAPEIVVAVIDTGIDSSHSFLENRFVDSYVNLVDNSTNTFDDEGHGTHVAGIIVDNTSENVKVMPYKVLNNEGEGYYSAICTAIEMAADSEVVDVINMSLGGKHSENKYNRYKEAIDHAEQNNIPVIVAAGNDDTDAANYCPANNETAITVSAINVFDKPAKLYSNYGDCVDIAAPGSLILSTVPNNSYRTKNGTSMAAPFVSAAAANVKSLNQYIPPQYIKETIVNSARTPDGWDKKYGVGILDMAELVSRILTDSPKITFIKRNFVEIFTSNPNSTIYYTTDGSVPIVGVSPIYTEPIDVSQVGSVKAIAFEEGKSLSAIATLNIIWSKNIDIRYMGRESVKSSYEIERFICSNEDIVSFDGEEIKGRGIGKASVTIFYETGQRVTYKVTVDFAPFQWFHEIIYKLFGVLLWSL